ncbi:MAG TPA: cyclic pyranopterin monophosphate synthase MoaC, partial [Gammaproteobacteria bacterium]|nr:cyclic pyranopterin monophosphate synthase MoaC [Gammaproteobacteria bacterium]
MTRLTHFNRTGDAQMVDVGEKAETRRMAVAEGRILMAAETLRLITAGEQRKGDVLGVARLAGIMAAKRTSELVPLCHPLMLSRIEVGLEALSEANAVRCTATVETVSRT